jgi:hypothetical protein
VIYGYMTPQKTEDFLFKAVPYLVRRSNDSICDKTGPQNEKAKKQRNDQ